MKIFKQIIVFFPNLFITFFTFITTTATCAFVVFFNFHQPVKLNRYQDKHHDPYRPNN